jgi:hypothetical protein
MVTRSVTGNVRWPGRWPERWGHRHCQRVFINLSWRILRTCIALMLVLGAKSVPVSLHACQSSLETALEFNPGIRCQKPVTNCHSCSIEALLIYFMLYSGTQITLLVCFQGHRLFAAFLLGVVCSQYTHCGKLSYNRSKI